MKAVADRAPTTKIEGLRIGAVAVRPGTGEVVAMYGGADYLKDQLNNATQAIAQAGSTFKPFALAAAIEDGISLNSTWNGDSGSTIGDNYTVRNYDEKLWGQVSLLTATEFSINVPYVELTNVIGPQRVVDMATRAGIPADTPALEPVLSVPLGVSSPHTIDIANAYATFASRGVRATPYFLKEVRGRNGGVLFEARTQTDRAMDEQIADTVNFALSKVIEVGTGRKAQIGRPAAGKTGTTTENKSAWFVGYTPDIAAAISFSKELNGVPVSLSGTGGMRSVTGGSFPAAIWSQFMRGALEGVTANQFVAPTEAVPTDVPTDPTVTTTVLTNSTDDAAPSVTTKTTVKPGSSSVSSSSTPKPTTKSPTSKAPSVSSPSPKTSSAKPRASTTPKQ